MKLGASSTSTQSDAMKARDRAAVAARSLSVSEFVLGSRATTSPDRLDSVVIRARPTAWTRPLVSRHWAHHGAPNISILLCLLDLALIGAGLMIVLGVIHQIFGWIDVVHGAGIVVLSIALSMGSLYALGCYRWDSVVARETVATCVPIAIFISVAASILVTQLVRPVWGNYDASYNSIQLIAVVVLSGGVTLVMAMLSRGAFYVMLDREWLRRRVLVVGTGERALYLHKLMEQNAHRFANDLHFVSEAVVGQAFGPVKEELRDALVDPNGLDLSDVARGSRIDEVVVATDVDHEIEDVLLNCKLSGIPVTHYHTFIERETGRVHLCHLEVSRLLCVKDSPMPLRYALVKRTIDVVLSLVMLIVGLPMMLAAAIALSLEGFGPIMFRQERVTQGGRIFWLYKFRTMRRDAEKDGPQWSLRGDPRVTRVGALLRRTRIDELPQLFNVLRGDMSLVGPRPERPMFVEQLSKELLMYDVRHSVKAGLTGWAQINYPYGASSEDAARKLEYDLYYIKNHSLMNDVSIVLQTLRVILWPPIQKS